MKILLVNGLLMVAFAVAISLSNAQDTGVWPWDKTTTKRPTTTTEPTTETTTVTSTTISSTITTEPTTVTSSTTASSTASSSTKPSPTTTPKPPPSAPPKGIWNVTSDGHTCILFDAGIRMKFNYETKSGKKVMGYLMDVPQDANATGTCEPKKQHINLIFNEDWILSFNFELDQTSKKYNVTLVTLQFNEKIFPDAMDTESHTAINNEPQFPTDADKQYKCKTYQSVLSKNNTLTGVIDISTFDLQFEAFGNFTKHDFSGGVNHCSADEVSQLVPIIVGAVLAGLIIVVLIAYLIGRRRSRRGYESV